MQKRVLIRIVFEGLTLKEAAEIEEKLEELLEEYGAYEIEITSISSTLLPPPA